MLAVAGLSSAALGAIAPGAMNAVSNYYKNQSDQAIAKMKAEGDLTKIEVEKLNADTVRLGASAQDHAAHGQYYKDSGWDTVNRAGAHAANMATTAAAVATGPMGLTALAVEDGGKMLDMTGRAATQLSTAATAVKTAFKGGAETYVGTTPLLHPLRVYENPITEERYIKRHHVAKHFLFCVSRTGHADSAKLFASLLRRSNSWWPPSVLKYQPSRL